MVQTYSYNRQSEYDIYAPIRRAFDVTPSATTLAIPTRAIMVSDSCTVTGVLVGNSDSEPHTTHTLASGVLYPFMFKTITAVSGGATVKGYA